MPTIAFQERWTIEAGGRWSTGMASKPLITVSGLNPASSDATSGIWIPPTTRPSTRMPPIVSGWCGPVTVISSIAANLAGWSSRTPRAATSPTTTWSGAATAASTNGMANPRRT